VLEGLVIDYGGGYKWLFGPCNDVALLIVDYLRSAHLEDATHAIYIDFLTWTDHTWES
jgi:hypothetical protein